MQFVTEPDPRRFSEIVGPFLDARIECNILATILLGLLDGNPPPAAPVLVRGVDASGDVAAVALRTPPWPMICSQLDAGAVDALVTTWLGIDPALNGVNAPAATATALADAWTRATGGSTRRRTRMAFYALRLVTDPPRPPAGDLRLATADQLDLMVTWWRAFADEAGMARAGSDAVAVVEDRVRSRRLWLWHDPAGVPVAMVAVNPAVAGVVRLGPVYTPPEHRRRGYAGASVAAVSRWALTAGARWCALFTDLANPTSNKIYAEVGYRPLGDWEEHEFTPR